MSSQFFHAHLPWCCELRSSHRESVASLGIANNTVSDHVRRASAGGLLAAAAGGLVTTPRWVRRLVPAPAAPAAIAGSPARKPDWATRPPGTAAVVGLEYREAHPDGQQYSRFLRPIC